MENFLNITSFYRFWRLSGDSLENLKRELEELGRELGLRGLIIVAQEGVNATVCGCSGNIESFKTKVRGVLSVSELLFKDATAIKNPFKRFKVKIRPEIVTSGVSSSKTICPPESYLSPSEWHETLSRANEGKEDNVLVLDTRNSYETGIGKFLNAANLGLANFQEFRAYLDAVPPPPDKKLLLYCTGGVRCEKAVAELRNRGYENVYQLHGGILKYLEEYPGGHFEGECFVFDHRVAVNRHLQPSNTYHLCPHCGNPGKEIIQCTACKKLNAVVCGICAASEFGQTCSKNCAYNLEQRKKRQARGIPAELKSFNSTESNKGKENERENQ